MLEEAVGFIRRLWRGGVQDHRGVHYRVDNARIYTLPDPLPPIIVASGGEEAARLAGRIGDGLVGTSPDSGLVSRSSAGATGGGTSTRSPSTSTPATTTSASTRSAPIRRRC